MVAVEIRSPIYNEESGQVEWRGLAWIKADGDKVEVFGERMLVHAYDLKVVDVETGKQLSIDRDAEAWARNLPYAFRGGDLVAEVVIDSDPPQEAETPAPQGQLPTIPAAPDQVVSSREATETRC